MRFFFRKKERKKITWWMWIIFSGIRFSQNLHDTISTSGKRENRLHIQSYS